MAASKVRLEHFAECAKEPESSVLFLSNKPFQVESAFTNFIDSCPPIDATITEVRVWLRSWFDVCGAFATDIALQPYIDRIELPGFLLHSLKKKQTLFDYFESINKKGDRDARVYDEEILAELTNYIFAAKEAFMTRPLGDEDIEVAENLARIKSKDLAKEKNKENILKGVVKGKDKPESKPNVVAEVTVTQVELQSPQEFRERQLEVYKQSMVDRHNSKIAVNTSRVSLPLVILHIIPFD